MSIRSIVRENLRNALEGGYDELRTMTTAEIARDMVNYCADCEDFAPISLVPYIDEFFGRAIASRPPSELQ